MSIAEYHRPRLSSIVIFIGIDVGFPAGRLARKWLHSTHWSCAVAASGTILAARQANASLKVRYIWRMLRMTRFIFCISAPIRRLRPFVPGLGGGIQQFMDHAISKFTHARNIIVNRQKE